MLVCYVDEAGDSGVYQPTDQASTPVFALAGVCVDDTQSDDLLMDYLRLKQRFEPGLRGRLLSDVIQHEVKGSGLRRSIRTPGSRNTRRRAIGYLDHVLDLLEQYQAKIYGRVLIKRVGETYPAASTYPSAVAELAATLEQQAQTAQTRALMILDAQTKVKNEGNVHTITTRRYRHGGNLFPTFVESPVFGHSDTHALLQIADLVASGLIYPAASAAYLPPSPGDAHRDPAYQAIRTVFGERLANLEYHYLDGNGRRRGGFRIIDRAGAQPTRLLLHNP